MITKDLREKLKDLLANEIAKLPEHLKQLEPKERIEITIKLMSFILPKIDRIEMSEGEPWNT